MTMTMPDEKIDQLERSILDLGAEIYHLKTELESLRSAHVGAQELLRSLRGILDEKGLVTHDDFESAVDPEGAGGSSYDPLLEFEVGKIKKSSH